MSGESTTTSESPSAVHTPRRSARGTRRSVGLVLGAAIAAIIFALLFVGSVKFGLLLGFGSLSYLFPLTAEFPVLVATLCWWELNEMGRSVNYAVVSFAFFLLLTIEYQIGNVVLPLFLSIAVVIAHIIVMTECACALALVVHLLIKTYAPEHKGTVAERRAVVAQRGRENKPIFSTPESFITTKEGATPTIVRAIALHELARRKQSVNEDGKRTTWKDIVAETGKSDFYVRESYREFIKHEAVINEIVSVEDTK